MPRMQKTTKRFVCPRINQAILAAAECDLQALVCVVEPLIPQMNLVNLSTAWHRLARASTSGPEALQWLRSQPVLERLLVATSTALGKARAAGSPPRCQALSNIAWAMATMQVVDLPLLNLIAALASEALSSFRDFELTSLLWSLANLSSVDPGVQDVAERIMAQSAHLVSRDFSFRCLVTVAWAFATLGLRDLRLFQHLADWLLPGVPSGSSSELANIAWAFKAAGARHDGLRCAVRRSALQMIHEFGAEDLVEVLGSCYAATGDASRQPLAPDRAVPLLRDGGTAAKSLSAGACEGAAALPHECPAAAEYYQAAQYMSQSSEPWAAFASEGSSAVRPLQYAGFHERLIVSGDLPGCSEDAEVAAAGQCSQQWGTLASVSTVATIAPPSLQWPAFESESECLSVVSDPFASSEDGAAAAELQWCAREASARAAELLQRARSHERLAVSGDLPGYSGDSAAAAVGQRSQQWGALASVSAATVIAPPAHQWPAFASESERLTVVSDPLTCSENAGSHAFLAVVGDLPGYSGDAAAATVGPCSWQWGALASLSTAAVIASPSQQWSAFESESECLTVVSDPFARSEDGASAAELQRCALEASARATELLQRAMSHERFAVSGDLPGYSSDTAAAAVGQCSQQLGALALASTAAEIAPPSHQWPAFESEIERLTVVSDPFACSKDAASHERLAVWGDLPGCSDDAPAATVGQCSQQWGALASASTAAAIDPPSQQWPAFALESECLMVVSDPFACSEDAAAAAELQRCAREASARAVESASLPLVTGGRAEQGRWACTVKRTFLEVRDCSTSEEDDQSGEDERGSLRMKDLGAPLSIIRCSDIDPDKLSAYRASNQKIRAWNALGAKGETIQQPV